jgi:HSP20 family protein
MPEKNNESRKPDEDESSSLAVPNFGLQSIFDNFMKPFDELMQPVFPDSLRSFWSQGGGREPVVDFQDRGDHFVLTAELPGFDKDDVEVLIDSNAIELKAKRNSEQEDSGESGVRRQSSYSYFQRRLTLPERIQTEKVVGTMKNGVLEVKLPKREPTSRARSRRVDLK